jgi:hypothetical protein
VFCVPIEKWFRFNKNCTLGLARLQKSQCIATALRDNFNEIKSVKLEKFNWNWVRLLRKRPYMTQNNSSTHYVCYEVTVKLLQMSGVYKKLYSASSYTPSDIMNGRVDMEDGYCYEPTLIVCYRSANFH